MTAYAITRIASIAPLPLNAGDLSFAGNDISGRFPTEVGRLTNLQEFSVGYTILTGSLPSEVAQLEKIKRFDLSNAALSGTIPEELYLARFPDVIALILSYNNFTGTVSSNVGLMNPVGYLYFSGNPGLVGSIPTEIGLLTGLRKIHVHESGFSGVIPMELCELRRSNLLTVLNADCFESSSTGGIPTPCPTDCCTKCCDRDTGICKKL